MLVNTGRAAAIRIAVLFSIALPLCAQDDLPDGKGKSTLENTCTECHGLDRVLTKLRTAVEWRSVTSKMRSKGATMSDDEFNDLVEYLSQNFGEPEPKPQKINVNRATAGELETGLALRPSDASAIVRHREAKGSFHDWRDLLEVEGIDKARIEAVKDRLSF